MSRRGPASRKPVRGKSPMDLADVSLAWPGAKLGTTCIFTEDRRDFLRYRLPDGSSFEVLP